MHAPRTLSACPIVVSDSAANVTATIGIVRIMRPQAPTSPIEYNVSASHGMLRCCRAVAAFSLFHF